MHPIKRTVLQENLAHFFIAMTKTTSMEATKIWRGGVEKACLSKF